jgi:hypothetical protein
MHEANGISDDIVEVSQIHGLARFIESERAPDGNARTICRNSFVGTQHMLEVMRNDIDQFEVDRLVAPFLAHNGRSLIAFLGHPINSMENSDAGEIGVANGPSVAVKVVKRRIDYDLQISSERFHAYDLLLITDFTETAGRAPLLPTDPQPMSSIEFKSPAILDDYRLYRSKRRIER